MAQSLSAKKLDEQLVPILRHVHHNKIISYQQFKQGILNPKDSFIANQTLPVFTQPRLTITRDPRSQRTPIKRRPQMHKTINLLTLSPNSQALKESRERILFVSTTSKIKRHLADGINIKKMRQAMFEERHVENRYEQFCRSLKERDKSTVQQRRQQNSKQSYRLFSSDIGKGREEGGESFRTTTRKIFWVKNKESQWIKQQPPQFLRIKCFSREDKD